MNLFLQRNKYPLLLAAVLIIAEILVNPLGQFPLNDDWSYTKTAQLIGIDKHVYIGSWCAMTLASHAVWGFLFIKVFGFSFFILRLSTLVSALIGLLVLYKLVCDISRNRLLAFSASLVLLLNPVYFNLGNTYMTDVNFSTWMIVALYFAHRFFTEGKAVYFILFFVMSAVLVLCRQFGLVLPLCFVLACLYNRRRPWLYAGLALVGFAAVYLSFKWYEDYLASVLPSYSAYKFSGRLGSKLEMVVKFKYFMGLRLSRLLLQALVYSAPFALLILTSLVKAFRPKTVLITALVTACILVPWLYDVPLLEGNVFTNMALGPETFYQSIADSQRAESAHTYSPGFAVFIDGLKLLLMLVTGTTLSLALLARLRNKREEPRLRDPFKVLLLSIGLLYIVTLFLSDSFFDRYTIPILLVALLLLAYISFEAPLNFKIAVPLLALFFYVSVAGTHDYMAMNRTRWQAFNYLKETKGLQTGQINAGFEVNNWDDGVLSWWRNYSDLNEFSYLIQYRAEPGFRLYKAYEFQRWFPPKNDKINIFVRDSIKPDS